MGTDLNHLVEMVPKSILKISFLESLNQSIKSVHFCSSVFKERKKDAGRKAAEFFAVFMTNETRY